MFDNNLQNNFYQFNSIFSQQAGLRNGTMDRVLL